VPAAVLTLSRVRFVSCVPLLQEFTDFLRDSKNGRSKKQDF
jgi:hypothetical protein